MKVLTNKEFENMTNYYVKIKYKCKCGRRVIIPKFKDYALCDWCNNYVFKDKKTEDLFRIKELIKRK